MTGLQQASNALGVRRDTPRAAPGPRLGGCARPLRPAGREYATTLEAMQDAQAHLERTGVLSTAPTRTPTPTRTSAPTWTPTPTPAPMRAVADNRAHCARRSRRGPLLDDGGPGAE
ncbi:hypothetical protein ACE1SV_31510 [Streptomyces sennicomposti]